MQVEETKTVSEDAQATSGRHCLIHDGFKSAGHNNASGTIISRSPPNHNPSTRTQTPAAPCMLQQHLVRTKPNQQACETYVSAQAAPQWNISRPCLNPERHVSHCDTDSRCAQHSEPCVRPETRQRLDVIIVGVGLDATESGLSMMSTSCSTLPTWNVNSMPSSEAICLCTC